MRSISVSYLHSYALQPQFAVVLEMELVRNVIFTAVLICCAQIALAAQAAPQGIDSMISSSESVIQILEKADLWVGGAVGVYDNGLKSQKVYGTQTPNSTKKPSHSAYYEIGSVSKSFTGILLALALKEIPGLDIDDNIGKFEKLLPELAANSYITSLTLRQLATHTAGLPDGPSNLSRAPGFDPKNPYVNYDESLFLDYLKSAQPVPKLVDAKNQGQYFRSYSNVGFATLGLILTKIYHQSFDDLVRLKITEPLGMSHTFINRKNTILPREMLAAHDVARNPTCHWQWDVFAPTGGIISTLGDMTKYLSANIHTTSNPLGRAMRMSHQLGLGWDSYPGDGIIMKNGQVGGFATFIAFDPVHSTGAIVLSNIGSSFSDWAAAEPVELSNQFPNSEIYKLLPPVLSAKIIPSAFVMQNAPGTFENSEGVLPDISLMKSNNSLLIFDGQEYDIILASISNPNLFGIFDGIQESDTIVFAQDGSGIHGFTLSVPSTDVNGKPIVNVYKYQRKDL